MDRLQNKHSSIIWINSADIIYFCCVNNIYLQGMGSRLMAQMGYVAGTGLGKHGEGRLEPVEVMVFPTGKSLGELIMLTPHARN